MFRKFSASMRVNGKTFEFGEFRFIPSENLLLREGEAISIPPKAIGVLELLVRNNGHAVSKDDLLREVWSDLAVEESTVSRNVWLVRQALGDDPRNHKFIQTIPKLGYRFIADVHDVSVGVVNGHEGNLIESAFSHPGSESEEAAAASLRKAQPSRFRLPSVAFASVLLLGAAIAGYFYLGQRLSSPTGTWSIAVLPFRPINTANRDEIYEIGLADSLIHRLSPIDGLVVRPLNAIREYTKIELNPLAAGREQKVDYVLASNYQVSDGKIKITSQLINVSNGQIEETFQSQRNVANVFAAQDAIAADFGSKLMARFGVSQRRPVRVRGTNNEEAYRAYVQGTYILDKRDAGALEYMDKAVALDPNYAKAWAGKALTHSQAADSRNDEDFTKANEAIRNALSINPDQSEAYTALCHLRGHSEWDAAGAEEACLRAIELDSTSAIARQTYSLLLGSRGRADESFAQVKIVMELEPASYINQVYYANLLYFARRLDEAVAQYRTVVDLKPERVATYNWFVRALEAQGKESEAFEWFIKSLIVEKKDDETIRRFKTAYESFGYKGVLLERIKTLDRDSPFRKAGLYARIGDKDKAFEMLEESYKERSWQMAILLPIEPQLDPIRNDPRYEDLLRRVEGR